MNKLMVLFFIIVSNTPVSGAVIREDRWKDLDAVVRASLVLIANDDFSKVLDAAEKLRKRSDNAFAIHECLKAAMYCKITEEYQTRDFEDEFEEAIKSALAVLAKKSDGKDVDDIHKAKHLQFLGSAYGYRGMYRTFKGEWGGAFMDGKRANDVLEESYKLDNSLVDNKAGIGTYLYWRSAKAGIVKYLLLWGDRKEEGIEDIKEALEKGKVTKLWSMGGLLRIYIEEKKGKLSMKIANKILSTVPRDSGTLRRKAFVCEKRKKPKEALKNYFDLLSLFKNNDNLVIGKKKLNTANVQIATIYNILRLSKELKKEVDTAKYIKEVKKLRKRISTSYSDIESLAEAVVTGGY